MSVGAVVLYFYAIGFFVAQEKQQVRADTTSMNQKEYEAALKKKKDAKKKELAQVSSLPSAGLPLLLHAASVAPWQRIPPWRRIPPCGSAATPKRATSFGESPLSLPPDGEEAHMRPMHMSPITSDDETMHVSSIESSSDIEYNPFDSPHGAV